MAASLEAQNESLEDILSEQGLKKEDLDKACSQAIRYEMAMKIRHWKMIGRCLEIPELTLHDIEVNNKIEEDRRMALLETWHKQKGRQATHRRLLRALYQRRRRDLVEDLCDLIKSHRAALTGKSHEDLHQSESESSVEICLKNLETRFNQHFYRLQVELNEKAISARMLRSSLTRLPSKLKMEYDSAIIERIPNIRKAKSVEDLFLVLGTLIHYIDYHLVKYFISTFGSEQLEVDMFLYEKDVKIFMRKTTVGDVMHLWPGQKLQSEDFKELWVKIGDDPNKYTLEKLNEMRNKHCANLKFSAILSAIVNLTPAGSFFAVWSVPTVAVEEVRKAICQVDREFYESEQVVAIILDGKLVYPSDSAPKADLQKKNEDKRRKVATVTDVLIENAIVLFSSQRIAQMINNDKQFVILTAGRPGVGKTTLINNFLQLEGDADFESRLYPISVTKTVKHCDRKVNGIPVRVIDMSSFHAADSQDRTDTREDVLHDLKALTGEGVDVIFYCISVLDRLDNVDLENLDTLIQAFGSDVWNHIIFVFTYTDVVLFGGSNPEELVERYIEALRNHLVEKRKVNVEIRSIYSFPDDTFSDDSEINKYDGIIGIPVSKNPAIPENWRITLLLQVIRKCRKENIPALLEMNRINWDEIKKTVETGAAIGTNAGAYIAASIGPSIVPMFGDLGINSLGIVVGMAAIGAGVAVIGGLTGKIGIPVSAILGTQVAYAIYTRSKLEQIARLEIKKMVKKE